LQSIPNCLLLGEKPYGELPALVAGCNALILPFKITPRSRARDCIKLYEYLATGRPVVTSEIPQARRFPGLLEVASKEEGTHGFAGACRRALEADTPELHARRKAAVQEHTWARRVETLESLVRERLEVP
jgi:O-antigen biosynthesis protein